MKFHGALDHDELFGNDSGEHEKSEVLKDYFIETPNFKKFFNHDAELSIVRARKGMGKSALLKILALRLTENSEKDIVIRTTGNELMGMGDFSQKSQAYLENHWKQVICKSICIEIGKRINFAASDSSISMVEVAEIEGCKNLNIISALTERMFGIVQKALAATGVTDSLKESMPLPTKRGVTNPIEALKNFQENGNRKVWILIDDIDAKYIDDEDHQERVGAFFSAIRSLAFSVQDIRIRASVRTDVWYNLRRMEDQDKIRQYVIDIYWKDDQLKQMFAKRILTFLRRNHFPPAQHWSESSDYRNLIEQVFKTPYYWTDNQKIDPLIAIKLLAGGRPRWMGQLCKSAGSISGTGLIEKNHVIQAMKNFGLEKISDINKEHSHQFPLIDKLIQSFRGGAREYNRYQLLKHIEDKFVRPMQNIPNINGYPYSQPSQLAEFLFEIDFLCAHRSGEESFLLYNNDPDLFSSEENNQNKILWTIHSSYRNFLVIR